MPERRVSRGSATGSSQRQTDPPERRQLDKELISSPRKLNSFLSGMEYRSHSGAKRRSPGGSGGNNPANNPASPRHCVFNTLTPQEPESAQPRITALVSTVAI